MNKLIKIILAILGGINTIFSVFIPTFIALLIIDLIVLSDMNQLVLIIVGLLSTLYRALSHLIPVIE